MATTSKTETVSLRFDKADPEDHSVEASTVAAGLDATSAFLKLYHEQHAQNQKFIVNTRPLAEGSLIIPLDMVLLDDEMGLVAEWFFGQVLEALKGFLELRVRLGEQEFSIEPGNVLVFGTERLTVDDTAIQMLNPDSEESHLFGRAFRLAAQDEEIRAIEYRADPIKTPFVRIGRDAFGRLAAPVKKEVLFPARSRETKEVLHIRSLSFDRSLSWHFAWSGRNIAAQIKDDEFMDRVRARRESFRSGDQLIVELQRQQEYDVSARTHVDKSFVVLKVYQHVQVPETGRLFDS